jgi:uncharacterized protein YeeX (DUF496 family)
MSDKELISLIKSTQEQIEYLKEESSRNAAMIVQLQEAYEQRLDEYKIRINNILLELRDIAKAADVPASISQQLLDIVEREKD